MDYEKKLKDLGIVLPPPPPPVGSYVPILFDRGMAYLSGQISKTGNHVITGKLGKDLTVVQGQEAARAAALNVLGLIQHVVTFKKFQRLIKVVGYVNVAEDFNEISQVINGASDLFVQVFGDAGGHARSSLGIANLPLGAAVEIEVLIALNSEGL